MFAQQAVAQQACPTLVVSNANDDVNGDTSSPCALIAGPGPDGISLREALLAANNATGSGTISINFASALAGETIALTERFAPITRSQITLTGLTNNGQPNITLDATSASNPGAIFFIATSNFTMSAMNVINLPTNFNGMQIGGFGYSLTGQMVSSPSQICCFQIFGNAFGNGTGSNSSAVYVPANQSNETISDVTIANNSFSQLFEAVNIQGGGPSVSNSVIQDIVVFGNTFSQMTSNGTSALEVGSEATNNTVQRVKVVQNTFTGNFQGFVMDINGASSGNLVQDVTVARNLFSGNLGALGIVAGVNSNSDNNAIMNTVITDNVIDLTGYQGGGSATIQIIDSQSGGTNDKVTGVSFVNNTIYNGTSSAPPGWGVWVTSSGGVTGVTIENTIFWGNESSPPLNGVTSPSQVNYSVIDQSGFSGVNNNNINADPLFVNSAGGNFALQSSSPALHAGTSAGAPAIDIDCQPRSSPPSIGAYEFQGPDICPVSPGHFATDTHDFNGDGMSDLLWRSTGASPTTVALWLMNGGAILSSGTIAAVPTTYSIVGQRDFNGDGDADLLWRDTSGNLYMWFMNGATMSSSANFGNVSPITWTVMGTADMNGDGKGDILWQDTSGDLAIWFMNGSTVSSSASLGMVPPSSDWSIVGTTTGAILWKNTTSSPYTYAVWNVNGSMVTSSTLGSVPSNWVVQGVGDFNGDGVPDILWRDLTSGTVAIWFLNSSGQVGSSGTVGAVSTGTTWAINETGDYDGNGKSDILWVDGSGNVAIWFMNGATIVSSISLGNVGTTWAVQATNAE